MRTNSEIEKYFNVLKKFVDKEQGIPRMPVLNDLRHSMATYEEALRNYENEAETSITMAEGLLSKLLEKFPEMYARCSEIVFRIMPISEDQCEIFFNALETHENEPIPSDALDEMITKAYQFKTEYPNAERELEADLKKIWDHVK